MYEREWESVNGPAIVLSSYSDARAEFGVRRRMTAPRGEISHTSASDMCGGESSEFLSRSRYTVHGF